MRNPDDLLDQIAATLREIDGLSDIVIAYHLDYPATTSWANALYESEAPCILICYQETISGRRALAIDHRFTAAVKPSGKIGDLFLAIREGVVGSKGTKFKLTTIDVKCDPPSIESCSLRSVFITETTSMDYYEVPIVLTERGADN